MAVVGKLTIALMATTRQFKAGLNKASADLRGFAGRTQSMIGGIAGSLKAAAPAAAVGIVAGIVREVEGFNQAMTRSTAIMGNLSAETKKSMADVARSVSGETQFSARQAAEAYFFLASAGMDAAQSMKALPQVAKFAQAGNFDLALATDLVTDAQSALGLSVKDPIQNLKNLTRVSDALVASNSLANASVEQFSKALTNKAGAAARAVGKDVEETLAVIAAFAEQGTKAEEAGTGFNIVLRDLQTKAIANAGAFKTMGIAVFDAQGEMNNIADIVEDLEGALGGLSDEQQRVALGQLGFSDKSIAFTQSLVGMSEKIRGYEKNLRMAAGTTDDVAAKSLTPMQKAVNRLRANWEAFSHEVGPPLINALVKVANAMSYVVERIMHANREMAMFAEHVDKIAGLGDFLPSNLGEFIVGPGNAKLLDVLGDKGAQQTKKAVSEALQKIQGDTAKGAEKIPTPPSVDLGIKPGGASNPVSGVGAVQVGSVEAFNTMQRAMQKGQSDQLQETKKQTKVLDVIEQEVTQVRRSIERPREVIEFA